MTALRWALGGALGCLVWIWVRTLRVVVESSGTDIRHRRVLAFLHGQQMALLAARRTIPVAVLVSRSKDGEIQAGVMRTLGFRVARGSSSRGGTAGLRQIVKHLERGLDAAFAVDGPRGPARIPKPGAAQAARLAGAELVPVASACARKVVLHRAWDAFEIPLPFSRVAVVIGSPIPADDRERVPELLAAGLLAVRGRAERMVTENQDAPNAEAPCRIASQ